MEIDEIFGIIYIDIYRFSFLYQVDWLIKLC